MAQAGIINNSNDLYAFVTALLGGIQLDQATFQTLLNTAQLNRELQRDWMVLKTSDSSQKGNSGDIFSTSKAMAGTFLKWTGKKPVKLVDNVANPNQVFYYTQIPFEDRHLYQNDSDKFYCDFGSSLLYLCGGNLSQQYTIIQDFIQKPADIIYNPNGVGSTRWAPFPAWADKILGYDIAAMQELGIDYDDLNTRMGNENAQKAELIFNRMERWDGNLAKNAAAGRSLRRRGEPMFRDKSIFIDG